jgi:hypothetical protein
MLDAIWAEMGLRFPPKIERLRFLQQMRAHAHMPEFKINENVCFRAGEHGFVEGVLTLYNLTVIADNGRQWNVTSGWLPKGASRGRG